MLKVTICYQETTPESAEDGEFSDQGIVATDTYSFRELIDKLKRDGYSYNGQWFDTYPEIVDYKSLTSRSESLHFDMDNHPRNSKHWNKIIKLFQK